MRFLERVRNLPCLGVGVSTEYGAGAGTGALDPAKLARAHPEYAGFLEIGIETDSGLDPHAEEWISAGRPVTYHYLDVNLEEPADLDDEWLAEVRRIADRIRPAWICGDAGMWHFGGREPGHMLLLPPVLCEEAAQALAAGIRRLRTATGREVLPENPPGVVFLGDRHLLDFFARVCELGDTGMLLDCAHLAIYQEHHGLAPLTGLDRFPLDRVVELHVAGAGRRDVDGWSWINDDHSTAVLDQTWEILEHVVPRCPNLRAIVFECERNSLEDALPGFARIASIWDRREGGGSLAGESDTAVERSRAEERGHSKAERPDPHADSETGGALEPSSDRAPSGPEGPDTKANTLQRVMVRMLFDLDFATRVLEEPARTLAGLDLPPDAVAWLRRPDPRVWRADLERPGRARRVLMEEFAASLAVIAESTQRLAVCDEFFRSDALHACIQTRGSLALTFGAYLQENAAALKDPRAWPLAVLETEIARLRRTAPADPDETVDADALTSQLGAGSGESMPVRLASDRHLVETRSGTAQLHEEILGSLESTGSALADAVASPPPLPFEHLDPNEPEYLLLELDREPGTRRHWLVGALEITAELYTLLRAAESPIRLTELERTASELGAADGSREILIGLIEAGVLVPESRESTP
ncbi:MAG: DUF692 family protein [Candidatus Eisenbacteria bacterium]|uniref:DUF692 family protein n=1 Tax=Eiseniibacteriota bacterium TaxID=2212470 RepID=A0A956LVQ6_UNCEI|nr:DUF692 family protein [Candidatus Eisenbacteria bacterium]